MADAEDHMAKADRYLDEAERLLAEMRRLICQECGVWSDLAAAGWRTYLTVDDEPATYCPECASEEFDNTEDARR